MLVVVQKIAFSSRCSLSRVERDGASSHGRDFTTFQVRRTAASFWLRRIRRVFSGLLLGPVYVGRCGGPHLTFFLDRPELCDGGHRLVASAASRPLFLWPTPSSGCFVASRATSAIAPFEGPSRWTETGPFSDGGCPKTTSMLMLAARAFQVSCLRPGYPLQFVTGFCAYNEQAAPVLVLRATHRPNRPPRSPLGERVVKRRQHTGSSHDLRMRATVPSSAP